MQRKKNIPSDQNTAITLSLWQSSRLRSVEYVLRPWALDGDVRVAGSEFADVLPLFPRPVGTSPLTPSPLRRRGCINL